MSWGVERERGTRVLRPRGKLTENRSFGDKWLVETTGPKARKGDG